MSHREPLQGWVINLSNDWQRWLSFQEAHVKLSDILHIQRFPAIDGRTARFPVSKEIRNRPDAAKVIGCFLSHRAVYQKLLSKSLTRIVVFEDDAIPSGELVAREILVKLPSDCLMLFLGHCFEEKQLRVAPHIYRSVCPRCTHAYIVGQKAARILLKYMDEITVPIDELIGRIIREGHMPGAYSVIPALWFQPWQKGRLQRHGGLDPE